MNQEVDRRRPVHYADARLQEHPITVHLAGCGGTGSQVLTGLARIHRGLLGLGHPFGLDVIAFDPDRVSAANIGRQLFSDADIGSSKAITLVHRLNCFFDTDWRAFPDAYTGEQAGAADVLITCIDSARGRREIAKRLINACHNDIYPYWLDCGNARRSGQVLLCKGGKQPLTAHTVQVRNPELMATMLAGDHVGRGSPISAPLPALWDMLPEVFQADAPEDPMPSCSLAEALAEQDLFINQEIATKALQTLWLLLSDGRITHHGSWVGLEDGCRSTPVPVPSGSCNVKQSKSKRKVSTNG